MKQKIKATLPIIVVLFFLFFISVSSVSSAPAGDFFVINEVQRECGYFWGGDEFSDAVLPDDWKIYDASSNLILKTPFGICDGEYTTKEDFYPKCCEKMGFKFVDIKNIPYTKEDVVKFNETGWKCQPRWGKDYYQGVIINKETNECTTLTDFELEKPNTTSYATEGQCSITDPRWIAYEYLENSESAHFEAWVATPFGMCKPFTGYENCCQQLGLKYVGKEISGLKYADTGISPDLPDKVTCPPNTKLDENGICLPNSNVVSSKYDSEKDCPPESTFYKGYCLPILTDDFSRNPYLYDNKLRNIILIVIAVSTTLVSLLIIFLAKIKKRFKK
jgi:hypothetical protein